MLQRLKQLGNKKPKSRLAPALISQSPIIPEGQASLAVAGKTGLESIREQVKVKKQRQGEVERTESELKLYDKWHEGEVDQEAEITTIEPRGVDPEMVKSMARQYFLGTTLEKAESSRLPPFVPAMTTSDEDNLKLLPNATEKQARAHLTKKKTKKQLREEKKYRKQAWEEKLKEVAQSTLGDLDKPEEQPRPSVEPPPTSMIEPHIEEKPGEPEIRAQELPKEMMQKVDEKPLELEKVESKPVEVILPPPPPPPKSKEKPPEPKQKKKPSDLKEKEKPLSLEKVKLEPGAGDAQVRKTSVTTKKTETKKANKKVTKKKPRSPSSSSSSSYSSSSSSSSEEDLWGKYFPFPFSGYGGYPPMMPSAGYPGYGYGPMQPLQPPQQPSPQTYQMLNAQMRGFQVPNPNVFQSQQPVPKPKVDVRATCPKTIDTEGLDFEFRPNSACGMEVSITIEPDEPDPIEFALDNGISPIVCCMMPPAMMVAPPSYYNPFQQQIARGPQY